MKKVKFGLAQINPTIADIIGNTKKIISSLNKGRKNNIQVIAFPEMAVVGYPAQDLLFRPEIIESNLITLDKIAPYTKGYTAVIVGYCQPAVEREKWRIDRQHLYNAYAVFNNGRLTGKGYKICLPTYSVFDDLRYFIPGDEPQVFDINGIKIGIEICEDLWYKNNDDKHPLYPCRPTMVLSKKKADIIVVLNASPYHIKKELIKEKLVIEQAKANNIPIFYVNMWGGNDKIIFDGNSIAVDKDGNVIARGKSFCDDLLIFELDLESKRGKHIPAPPYIEEKNLYKALVVGKRDYHKKCGIKQSVIGISGGIDSATVLAIDTDALGKKNVLAVLSPGRYTSKETLNDAIKLCKNFRVDYKIVPIEEKESNRWIGSIPEKNKRYIKFFGQPTNEVVFENQQAIDRMSILRAIANQENRLISGTGNKTELAMGYATVCGDLQADILVIGDLYKQQVYAVAKYINRLYSKEMIPETIIARVPSAELAEGQVDPFDYDRLDELVKLKVEDYLTDEMLLKHAPTGQHLFTEDEIKKYSRLIDVYEHKRFKSGYILKVSPVAFGEDRRINTAKKITLW
ncbi:MAG: NAD(+) synthase [Nitrospirota bacterium]